jgi:hypothetical protein
MIGRRARLALAALAAFTAACGDSTSPESRQLRVTVDPELRARAGEQLDRPIRIEVVDASGVGLADVPVTLRVLEGGGTVDRPNRVTDARGLIELRAWTMGERPGTNRISVEVEGLEPAIATVQAGAGPAARLEPLGTIPARASVATSLTTLPQVRVTDRFNNPISGARVRYTASGGGTVTDTVLVSNAEGLTRQTAWRLGTLAGPQTLRVSVEGAPDLLMSIQADPGPPSRLTWDTPQNQGVEVGLFVVHSPTARVTDQHGNPIAGVPITFRVESGGGRLEGIAERTDSDGRVRVQRWYLGSQPGPNSVSASGTGFTSIVLTARALATNAPLEGRYFTVAALHVNQGSQSSAGDIPLVAGRAGVLRVFVQASEAGAPAPEIEVRVFGGGTLLETRRIAPPSSETPTSVSADLTTPSWNLNVPANWVTAGLAAEVVVDPQGLVGVTTRRVARYPIEGLPTPMNVVSTPTFRVRFMPLRDQASGQQGDIHALNLDGFTAGARRVLPIGALEVTLAPAFTTDLLTSEGRVQTVLGELQAACRASSFQNQFFHGIFPAASVEGLPYYGVAFLTNSPSSTCSVAQSWDRLPQAAYTVAHELGHNLGRPHAPCGNPAQVDPSFPYGNARLGTAGWDTVEQVMRSPSQYFDMMSYCNPEWISDYNFRQIVDWRRRTPGSSPAMAEGAPGPGVLIWGGVTGSSAYLEPAFPVTAAPFVPSGGGSHRLTGFSASGEQLFRFEFDPQMVADAPSRERHFAFVVPVSDATALARIELETPTGDVALRSRSSVVSQGAPPVSPGVVLSGPPEARTLAWNPVDFPLAVLRDRVSQEIVGFGRSGRLTLDASVEVTLSDGIRGWRVTTGGLVEP